MNLPKPRQYSTTQHVVFDHSEFQITLSIEMIWIEEDALYYPRFKLALDGDYYVGQINNLLVEDIDNDETDQEWYGIEASMRSTDPLHFKPSERFLELLEVIVIKATDTYVDWNHLP